MKRVMISVGDASGDRIAAQLVRCLAARRADLQFSGLTGAEMRAAGVEAWGDANALAVGGLVEVAGSLRRVLRLARQLVAAALRSPPDLVVFVDAGGFHLPLARRLRRAGVRAPILYYVAPQIWAWRRGRIRRLAARIDRLAVIFPFEPAFYAATSLRVDYVGHPLVEPLARIRDSLTADEARQALGLRGDRRWVALFPGSRRNELRAHLNLMLESAAQVSVTHPDVGFAVAVAPGFAPSELRGLARSARAIPDELTWLAGDPHRLIRAAELVVTKPGTATLEAALLRRPMVVVGRAHPVTAWLARALVQVPFLAMPNLIAARPVVPELLQEHATPARLAAEMIRMLGAESRAEQLRALEEVCERLGPGGASDRAADIALEMLDATA